MKIKLNGQDKEFENSFSILELITNLDLLNRRIAVLLNDDIVKKEEYESVRVKDGDAVEIVQMVGGG